MIKMLNAFTQEIDEPVEAVKEILNQLDLSKNGKKNMVGLLTCYPEFVESGVTAAIARALPFPLVGCTTLGGGVNGNNGMLSLSLTVLASDDVGFEAVFSEELSSQNTKPLEDALKNTAAKNGQSASLAFGFLPMISELGGERYVEVIDKALGGVPLFGTIACDHNQNYSQAAVIFGEESAKRRAAVIVAYGDIEPKFTVYNISDKKLQKQRALITDSDGSLLKGVNGLTPMEYLKSIGLSKGDGVEGVTAIPFLVDYGDGAPPLARAMYMLLDNGNIVCGGAMPTGATLSIGTIDYEDVITTTSAAIQEIKKDTNIHGAFIIPCLSRCMVLGTDNMHELDAISRIAGDLPHHIIYSGGEFCPVYTDKGTQNRFHNFSIAICTF